MAVEELIALLLEQDPKDEVRFLNWGRTEGYKGVGKMIEIGENLMYAISAVAFFGFLAVIMKD